MKRLAIIMGAVILVLAVLVGWRLRIKNYEYHYRNRAALISKGPFRLLTPELPQKVAQTHDQVSEQSLLIRDLRVVEPSHAKCLPLHACDAWTFPNVIKAAFTVGNAPADTADSVLAATLKNQLDSTFDGLVPQTLDSTWTSGTLVDAPFMLLAIVNRMDLAHVQNGVLSGAELRFEYEAVPSEASDDYLRLIVEFVLPDMAPPQFQGLANSWMGLSTLSLDCPADSCFETGLQDLIVQRIAQAKSVRVRALGKPVVVWDPREFIFQGTSLTPHALEREPNVEAVKLGACQDSKQPMGQFAVQNTGDILDSNYEFDQPLACLAGITDSSCANDIGGVHNVLRLGKDLNLGSQLDEVRFDLSINSCTACHFEETGTQNLLHVGARTSDQPSQLSGFLTGQEDCNMSDSPSGRKRSDDPIPYCTVSKYLDPYPLGNCAGTDPQPRSFNDLLRRQLYLYTVQNMSGSASPEEWKNALDPFTAYQVH